VGLGPDRAPFTEELRRPEARFWQRRLDEHFYDANIGLTFAVYRGPNCRGHFRYDPALRVTPALDAETEALMNRLEQSHLRE